MLEIYDAIAASSRFDSARPGLDTICEQFLDTRTVPHQEISEPRSKVPMVVKGGPDWSIGFMGSSDLWDREPGICAC